MINMMIQEHLLPKWLLTVSTVVGSAVLGINIGLGLRFSGLVDPARIMLQVKQKEVGINNVSEQRIQKDIQCVGGTLIYYMECVQWQTPKEERWGEMKGH